MKRVELKRNGVILIPKCNVAKSFWSRFRGWMGKRQFSQEEAILFPRCRSVHTFFMFAAIDVVGLGPEGQVVKVWQRLAPWRMTLPCEGVDHTLELPAGRANVLNLCVGDILTCGGFWNEI